MMAMIKKQASLKEIMVISQSWLSAKHAFRQFYQAAKKKAPDKLIEKNILTFLSLSLDIFF